MYDLYILLFLDCIGKLPVGQGIADVIMEWYNRLIQRVSTAL